MNWMSRGGILCESELRSCVFFFQDKAIMSVREKQVNKILTDSDMYQAHSGNSTFTLTLSGEKVFFDSTVVPFFFSFFLFLVVAELTGF